MIDNIIWHVILRNMKSISYDNTTMEDVRTSQIYLQQPVVDNTEFVNQIYTAHKRIELDQFKKALDMIWQSEK